MIKLYIDDFVKRQGFKTTQQYLEFCYENHNPARFKGEKYFSSLFQAKIIVPDFSFVRVMYVAGTDQSYGVTEDGRLEGLDLQAHSGRMGIHNPAEILSLENAPDGWDLESFRLPRT
jgi:hypothetical protein